uniref:CUGBP Elav-like family member 2 n=1 Tax=Rhinopithecus roxellana TaxID=61622 RepID=A0A2K6RP81_RHIRO
MLYSCRTWRRWLLLQLRPRPQPPAPMQTLSLPRAAPWEPSRVPVSERGALPLQVMQQEWQVGTKGEARRVQDGARKLYWAALCHWVILFFKMIKVRICLLFSMDNTKKSFQ